MNMIERLEHGFKAFGKEKTHPIHVYPDMRHGFHADYRPSYRKEQAADAWKRMNAWFKKHGVA
jgi:carboxymethylenebutenolidase